MYLAVARTINTIPQSPFGDSSFSQKEPFNGIIILPVRLFFNGENVNISVTDHKKLVDVTKRSVAALRLCNPSVILAEDDYSSLWDCRGSCEPRNDIWRK